jgi:hypothetical protein
MDLIKFKINIDIEIINTCCGENLGVLKKTLFRSSDNKEKVKKEVKKGLKHKYGEQNYNINSMIINKIE